MLRKPRFCGIIIKGLIHAPQGVIKLRNGLINENNIHLDNGSVGILFESCENYGICKNRISGELYYDIGLFPGTDDSNHKYGAENNIVEINDLSELTIKPPDDYSRSLFMGRYYKESTKYNMTSQIFLNNNCKNNTIIQPYSTIIDDGLANSIIEKNSK